MANNITNSIYGDNQPKKDPKRKHVFGQSSYKWGEMADQPSAEQEDADKLRKENERLHKLQAKKK